MTEDTPTNSDIHGTEAEIESVESRALLNAHTALKLVSVNLPWLSPLTYHVRMKINASFAVAAVNRKGEIFVNPEVFSTLSVRDATFVIAHELLHIALDTFSRESSFDNPVIVNRAHDYIINDLLVEELRMDCPLGGLMLYGASQWSLEKMVAWMMEDPKERCQGGWQPSSIDKLREKNSPLSGTLGSALQAAGIILPEKPSTVKEQSRPTSQTIDDVIFSHSELNASIDATSIIPISLSIQEAVRECLALKAIAEAMASHSRGSANGNLIQFVEATKAHYQPTWQQVLQKWLEAVMPSQRSFARPSRRGTHESQCFLPGRIRTGWTLHIILDTSGSMTDSLAYCLGAIAEYCSAAGVAEVRIIQCDADVSVDEFVDVDELRNYRIMGYGGSDLSPAINLLNEDIEVSGAIVITDGMIGYPEIAPHYDVLWTLTWDNKHFQPNYGNILPMYQATQGLLS